MKEGTKNPYYIEVKVVATKLSEIHRIIDEFKHIHYQIKEPIQNQDGVYWCFMAKNNGLLDENPIQK